MSRLASRAVGNPSSDVAGHYRADIDGLRAAAVLPVIVAHVWNSKLPGGHLGVDVFFVISGYLITAIVQRELGQGTFSFQHFYLRRARRILPAFLFVTSVTLLVSWALHPPHLTLLTSKTALAALLFASNLFLPSQSGYFEPSGAMNPLLHTWSLGVEEQFYLVFPATFFLLFQRARALLPFVIFAIVLISLLYHVHLEVIGSNWAHYSPLGRAWQLTVGSLLALRHASSVATKPPIAKLNEALGAAGLVLLAYAYRTETSLAITGQVCAVGGALCVLHAGFRSRPVSLILLRLPACIFVGLVSYSLYLWHQPVAAFLRLFVEPASYRGIGVVMAVSLGLAAATWAWVEQPARRSRQHAGATARRLAIPTSILAAVTLLSIGTEGFSDRYRDLPASFFPSVDETEARRCTLWDHPADVPINFCKFGPTLPIEPAKGTVAVWGDSQAMALVSGMISSKRDFPFVHLGIAGCGLAVQHNYDPEDRNCLAKQRAALSRILIEGDISTVVMHAERTGSADEMLLEWRHILGVLQSARKRVIIVGPIPVYWGNPVDQLMLQHRLGLRKPIELPLSNHKARMADVMPLLQSLAAEFGVEIIDPSSLYCDERACRMDEDGIPLYADDGHLNTLGARRLTDELIQVIDRSREPAIGLRN